jgi:hypothetical protein
MVFMKMNTLFPRKQRQSGASIGLAAFLSVASLHCTGQDSSCKAVADAQSLARTPHHAYSTETRAGRTILSEEISTPGGVFWGTGGVWHRSTSSIQEFTTDTAEPLKELRDCRHVSDEVLNGALASNYSLHNQASGGDESV